MQIPGIHGDWTMIDCKDGMMLMRSVDNGIHEPMLVVDKELNLIGETDTSLEAFIRSQRRGAHGP